MDRSGQDDVAALLSPFRAAASPLRAFLRDLHGRYQALRDGAVADYIPELTKADPDWFGLCLVTTDGQRFEFGDIEQPFTIQSISKPFVYGMALADLGREATLAKISVEPSGDAFNSIELEPGTHRPHNPMVNAGAIAAASLVTGEGPADRLNHVLETFARYIGHPVGVDMAVFTSERATGHRNRAIAHLMRNFDIIDDRIEEALDLYFKQCSILVTCRDLAMMAATLANGGVHPLTGDRAVPAEYVRDILSLMYTCGMYDFAGEWAYRVGLPAKSGVGGGIIAVVPGQAGVAVFSPPLDARGNSVRGIRVCEELSNRFGLHIFDCHAPHGGLAEAMRPHGRSGDAA
ncbi:glutaminase A [bacterium]|nr:glutaminase A [bacterium]